MPIYYILLSFIIYSYIQKGGTLFTPEDIYYLFLYVFLSLYSLIYKKRRTPYYADTYLYIYIILIMPLDIYSLIMPMGFIYSYILSLCPNLFSILLYTLLYKKGLLLCRFIYSYADVLIYKRVLPYAALYLFLYTLIIPNFIYFKYTPLYAAGFITIYPYYILSYILLFK